ISLLVAALALALAPAPAAAQQPPGREAAAHISLGDAYARQRAYDKAIEEYDAAAAIDPKPLLLFKKASAYERMGDPAHTPSLYQRLRAVELEGRLADEARGKIATLTVAIRRNKELWGQRDDDGDGVKNADDRCPDQPEDEDGFQDADGCPDPDNDGDGILDG